MKKRYTVALICFVVTAATYFAINEYYTSVVINDVAVSQKDGVSYRVIKIDGSSPRRIKSYVITMVPFVITSPGFHEVEIEKKVYGDNKTEVSKHTISQEFKAYTRYKIVTNNETIEFTQ